MKQPRWYRLLSSIAGLIFIFLAVFAVPLGIDNDAGWGTGRIFLVLVGIFIILLSCILPYVPMWLGKIDEMMVRLFETRFIRKSTQLLEPALLFLRRIMNFQPFSKIGYGNISIGFLLQLIVPISLVITVQWWLVTAGRLTAWPASGMYYDMQADAFIHGQLNLLLDPSPGLLALTDPYDLQLRESHSVDYLWDASLYQGKYYLYWGPLPAILLIPIKLVLGKGISDLYLVFSFLIAFTTASALLLALIWKRHFQSLPLHFVSMGIMVIGLVNPLPFILMRPSVYEAAILGGQFFLFLGLFCALSAVELNIRRPFLLAAASLCWGFALACRIVLIGAIGIIVLFFLYCCIRLWKGQAWPAVLSLLAPIAICTGLLVLFNFARFENIWETGQKYQLTIANMPVIYADLLSIKNIIPNLYLQLFHLPAIQTEFPFLAAKWINESSFPFFISLNDTYYYSEPIAGVLIVVPMIWLAVFFIGYLISTIGTKKSSLVEILTESNVSINGLVLLLLAGSTVAFFLDQLFWVATMRYQIDWLPLALIFGLVGLLLFYHRCEKSLTAKMGISFVSIFAAVMTILAGILIGISGPNGQFEKANPLLFNSITQLFN